MTSTEALKRFEDNANKPDIILLDYNLEYVDVGLSGFLHVNPNHYIFGNTIDC